MAGKPGMHKKATITKDETLTVAARSNGQERPIGPLDMVTYASDLVDQEEKFIKELTELYTYWRRQPGDQAKAYAAAYRTLLNEFTAEENKE